MADLTSKKYWRERAQRIIAVEAKKDDDVIDEVRSITNSTMSQLSNEIYSFYAKYADAEGISVDAAKKKIQKTDIKELEDRVAQYVKNKDFSEKANAELRQYNTKMYVSRERMLLQQLSAIMVNGTALTEVELSKYLETSVDREVERQAGILGNVRINPNDVRAIVNADFHGETWSNRLWADMEQTRKTVLKTVQNAMLRGRHPDEFVPELKKKLGVTTSDAKRLLITETARVQTEAQKLHYTETIGGDATIEFVAKLDDRTSDECRHADGNKIKVSEMVAGVNVPPLHPYCRSTTVPAVDEIEDELEAFFKEREGKYNLKNLDDELDEQLDPEPAPEEIVFNEQLTEAFGEEQLDEIKRQLDNNKDAEGAKEYRKIWNHFAPDMTIQNLPSNRTAHFDPMSEKVKMPTANLAERDQIRINGEIREGTDSYSTVIHEFSHMIDLSIQKEIKGAKNMFNGGYTADPNYFMNEETDEREMLADVLKKEIDDMAKAEHKVLKDAHKSGNTDVWDKSSKPRISDGRRKMISRLREQYHLGDSNGLSDMIEAATNGRAKIAYGHGKSYWGKHPAYKTPLQANLEAFAEMSETFMSESKREVLQKEVPKSYALYLEMLKTIVKRLGL
ncbi:minor capsid protein [Staphylococcus equorum]|uniref:minor capsid protein n=1 Tax=Staphylococcus equorum TaxID=246432 RepID=UPI0020CF9196|nr:minor capsid protein [Staphylococcus equorum]UTT55159.1 minor capsid protein [Staphylococcus equorum]UTT55220.1 minor capsid protein [Staphylococcus equorum]